MKRLYIHAGLHKTGSTALQVTLHKNRQNLELQDVYYAKTGTPYGLYGQHNIAWQLSRDRRFRNEYGNIGTLLKEIQVSNHSKIVLSSEDFECSLLHPSRWMKIIDHFSANNIKVTFVIYLRNQINYVRSLYFELLKAGLGEEFKIFARKIAYTTNYNFNEWEFIFNYQNIFNSLNSLKNVEVVYRDYDDLINNNTVVDFCHVIGIDHQKIELPNNINQINKTLHINTLIRMFIKNRVKNASSDMFSLVDELCAFENPSLQIPSYLRKIFLEISNKNSFYKNTTDYSESRIAGALNIEKVFSFETCNLILNLNGLRKNHTVKKNLIENWSTWVTTIDK